jgi:CIC family chloride channel protein
VDPARTLADVYLDFGEGSPERRQRLYPVLDHTDRFIGILPWSTVLAGKDDHDRVVVKAMIAPAAVAYPDEILRAVADRMAGHAVGVIPVVDRGDPGRLDGLITQFDLLSARQKLLEEERHAERVLALRRTTRGAGSSPPTPPVASHNPAVRTDEPGHQPG